MTLLNIRPIGNAVIVKLHPYTPRVFAGGLLIAPDTAREDRWQKATVLAVGNGRAIPVSSCPYCESTLICDFCGNVQSDRAPVPVKVGDEVWLERGLEKSGWLQGFEVEDGSLIYFMPVEHIKALAVENAEAA